MDFHLNPQLDLDQLSREFREDRRVRISNLLPEDQSRTLSQALAEQTLYRNAFVLDNNYGEVADTELRALPQEDRERLLQGVLEQAARGVGFWYGRRAINQEDTGVLGGLFHWLNSADLLAAISRISGDADLRSASAQATRFKSGDFLTRHQDVVTEEQRRLAFVINVSPQWHPDWGGLLQFYRKDGTPRDAWSPDFNTLSLFDVEHVHAVTCISPFAPRPRLAVSGWFRLR